MLLISITPQKILFFECMSLLRTFQLSFLDELKSDRYFLGGNLKMRSLLFQSYNNEISLNPSFYIFSFLRILKLIN